MEELPRVDPHEDPYLALRTALAVALCLLLAEPLGITMPMLPAVMGMSIMSNQRGALNPRVFATPIALPVIGIIFSWVAAVTVNEPMVFTLVNIGLAVGGLALMLFKGSRGGMMLTVFPLMMAMSALYSDYALAVMRDSMVMGGVALGVAVVGLNLLFPPRTKRVHEEVVAPLVSGQARRHLLIRSAVYLPVMLATFASGDMNLMIVPIMLVFVCAEPRRGTQVNQIVDRGGGTMVGALIAIGVLTIYSMIPELPVLILLCTVVTYFLIDKMTTGKRRPLIYQYTCSAALVMILQATTGGRDALEVVLQRVVMTGGAMMAAIMALALLEAIFLAPEDEAPAAPPAAQAP
ncbi:FUSC family protein [Devosia sp.]|uniref:FUSC family protein n=1 Tax=Devosia sp. TaxID=1871048 RepID=UPI002AFEACAF|nr:FUSC family protein [Devosia sp.]